MQLNAQIDDSESISRFVFQSGHHSATALKWKAFEPRNGEVSIFRVDGLQEADIWDIGFNHVGKLQGREPKCRKDFLASVILELGLGLVSETKSHPRHGNIVNWPASESEELLMAKKVVAKLNETGAPNFPPQPADQTPPAVESAP